MVMTYYKLKLLDPSSDEATKIQGGSALDAEQKEKEKEADKADS